MFRSPLGIWALCLGLAGCGAAGVTDPDGSPQPGVTVERSTEDGVGLRSVNAEEVVAIRGKDGRSMPSRRLSLSRLPSGEEGFRNLIARRNGFGRAQFAPSFNTEATGDDAPAVITGKWTDLFPSSLTAESIVRYQGDQARNTLNVTVTSGGSPVGTYNLPHEGLGEQELSTDGAYFLVTTLPINVEGETCGLHLTGSSTHSAWRQIRFPVLITWGTVHTTSTAQAQDTPACPGDGGGTVGGGGQADTSEDGTAFELCYRTYYFYEDGSLAYVVTHYCWTEYR